MGFLARLPLRAIGALVLVGAASGILQWHAPRRTVIQELDGWLGWRMLPDQHRWDRFLRIPEDINSYGFRGIEWSREKAPGRARILALGSSMTYGSSVPFERIYTTRLEALLRERGLDVEVLNAAVQGYTLEQSVRNYESQGSRLKPDLVLQAFADQDVKPMEPARAPARADLRPWLARTEYYQRFLWDWRPWLRRLAPENPVPAWAASNRAQKLNEKLQANPFDPELEPLWRGAESAMARLRDAVARDGGTLVITVLPQPPQAMDPRYVGPEMVWKRFVEGSERAAYVDAISGLREALAPFRERLARAQDPAEQYRLFSNAANDPAHVYLGDVGGHFNENGMRVIAESLARGLAPLLSK